MEADARQAPGPQAEGCVMTHTHAAYPGLRFREECPVCAGLGPWPEVCGRCLVRREPCEGHKEK